jgi:hypothetical protein
MWKGDVVKVAGIIIRVMAFEAVAEIMDGRSLELENFLESRRKVK